MIGAPGKQIQNPKLIINRGYVVFVQSMGIGRRPLEAGSRILYDREVHTHIYNLKYMIVIITHKYRLIPHKLQKKESLNLFRMTVSFK